jgi:hypothetical protein
VFQRCLGRLFRAQQGPVPALQFQVLKTEHFDVYYYDEERAVAEQAARMAERWYERLSRMLGHELSSGSRSSSTPAIRLRADQRALGELDEGTGGVTEFAKRRIVLPLAGPLAETDHVIGHELVHAFQYDLANESRSQSGEAGLARLPLWFIEGMAEYLSLGARDANTAMWIRDARRSTRFPMFTNSAIRASFRTLRPGDSGRTSRRAMAMTPSPAHSSRDACADVEQALERGLGVGPDSLSAEWLHAIRAWYTPIAAATQTADHFGRS